MTGTNGTTPNGTTPNGDGPLLEVLIGCVCPDGGHGAEGDTITLRPTLDYTAVRAIRYAGAIARDEDEEASIASLMAVMNEGFILHGIASWTLREDGKPVEVSPSAIRRLILANTEAALIVGDYADAVYQPQVLLPLLALAGRSSRPSPMTESTSPPNGSGSTSPTATDASPPASSNRSGKHPKRSKRSSITSIPTDSTEPITSASGGGSTSSPS